MHEASNQEIVRLKSDAAAARRVAQEAVADAEAARSVTESLREKCESLERELTLSRDNLSTLDVVQSELEKTKILLTETLATVTRLESEREKLAADVAAKAAAAIAAEAEAISAAAARKSKRDPQVADIVKLRKAIGNWDNHRMAMFALMQAANTDGVEAAMLWINPERGSM